jgi:hypothetical protein
MDYSIIKNQVQAVIREMGQTVKIQHQVGGTSQTQGVWSTSKDGDLNQVIQRNPSQITETNRIIYINATKKEPQVGDLLIVNAKEYAISTVEVYQPTKLILAYKLGVQN